MKKWFRRVTSPRFIIAQCFLIDKALLNMQIEQQGEPVLVAINLSSIESVRQSMDDDGKINNKEVVIYYKSGESVVIDKGFQDMLVLMERYGYY